LDTKEELEPGPVRRALDALWERHAGGWRRLLSPGVIRELKLRAYFDVDLVAPHRIANKIPAGTIPDCAACEDICCAGIENVVSLRLSDIAELIDIGRTDLMTKKKPNFPAEMVKTRPALYELAGSELFRTLPVLRQIGDSRICAALTPELTCSLYPHWPTSCERFPYTLSPKRRTVSWGTRCPSKQCAPEFLERSEELFTASIDAYNERVKDAVLLVHARKALDELGIGAWLVAPGEDPFEPKPKKGKTLPVVE
jgi:Fe-S-cluster containining protein